LWRKHFKNAKTDKDDRLVAHAGMNEVRDSFERLANVLSCSFEKAREIFGEDCFGVPEIEMALGFKPNIKVPRIKFTAEELKEAQAHGEMLVLRIGEDNESRPMTMKRILEIMAARMPTGEKLLYDQKKASEIALKDDCWFKDEDFFAKEGLKTEWVLIGKEFAPNTVNNNYAHQTLELYKMMKARNLLTPEEVKEYAGLEDGLKKLCKKMGLNWETQGTDDSDKYAKNWAAVARELANLPINQRHRRSFAGVLYDWVIRFKSRKGVRGQLGNNFYDWSNTVSSAGHLMTIGDFDSHGAYVHGDDPGPSDVRLGVVFVRGSSLHK
jgi:hypothetical protein